MTQIKDDAREVAAAVRAMGQTFNEKTLKATYALYTPLQERAPRGDVAVHKDLAYGEDQRQRLDVFVPPEGARRGRAPMVVYFHGGGYVGGERSPLPGLIYDNVPTFFARHGMIGVNATYRLAPAHRWPCGAQDVGRSVAWLRENAARYGGDPERIVVMGQSAGATHVASWTFMESVHGAEGPRVAGAILLSGVYAFAHPAYSRSAPGANHLAYYGEDAARWTEMCPLGHVKPGHPPVFLAVAEFDPYPLAWPSAALLDELVRCDRRMPWFRVLRGHNHVSPAMQINSAIDTLGPELLAFVDSLG